MREPGRGHWERAAAGANAEVVATDEIPPSFAESMRILWQIGTLRRIWYSLPFLAAAFIGLSHADDALLRAGLPTRRLPTWLGRRVRGARRKWSAILLGMPLASRLMLRDPGVGMRMLAIVGSVRSPRVGPCSRSPDPVARDRDEHLVSASSRLLVPGIFAALSLTIPPKVRSMGFSMAALFIVPGFLGIYIVRGIADTYGTSVPAC